MGCSFEREKGITITNSFQKLLDESGSKPNKIRVDKGSEFCNRSMISSLEKKCYKNIYMWATSKGKSVATERFIRTLKDKSIEYMTSISKIMYIDKLYDIVNKYNNTYLSTVKMNPIDAKSSMYIDFDKKNNKENPKFKVGDNIRISKYKNIFAKGFVPNWSKEMLVICVIHPWTYIISNLNGEEIARTFYEKWLQKINQEDFTIDKAV